MRVLHLSSERGWRGGEQQISYLIEESLKQGVECHVITRENSEFEKHCKSCNWIHLSAPFKNQFDLKSAKIIKDYCRNHRIDLIHVHSSHSHALSVLSAVIGNKTPIILSRRVDFKPKSNFLTQFKYKHKQVKKIICVSHAIENILKSYGLKPELLCTVHSGVDLSRFQDNQRSNILRDYLGLNNEKILIGNISALADHKDYPTFLKVAKELQKDERFHFVIIGSGELEDTLKDIASQYQLNNLTFTGFRQDVAKIFKDLDIFLMTSKTEGLGTTVLDAFANSVPVVATKAGGIPEMVNNKTTGILCDIGDVKSLSQGVLTLSSNEELQKQIMKNAFKKLEAFKKEKTAQRTVSIYKEILSNS